MYDRAINIIRRLPPSTASNWDRLRANGYSYVVECEGALNFEEGINSTIDALSGREMQSWTILCFTTGRANTNIAMELYFTDPNDAMYARLVL